MLLRVTAVHYRDLGDAGNPIFKSVLSSMVDLHFSLMPPEPRLRDNVLNLLNFDDFLMETSETLFIDRVSRRGDFFAIMAILERRILELFRVFYVCIWTRYASD